MTMKKTIKLAILAIMAISLFSTCAKTPDIDDATMLDGDQIFDLTLFDSSLYLASVYLSNPTEEQKNTPVIIAAHGYSATTFEWDELRNLANSSNDFYVSQVLLGGHGRSYEDFKASTWEDWQKSIMVEYRKLSNLGFKNISLAGSSTGCPLIIEMVSSGKFDGLTTPKNIFLIDPIVVSSNKTLTLVGLLGPVLGYTSITLDSGETGKWYIYRPQETLKQLMELIDLTRINLEKGITLPQGTILKTYKSSRDATADPVSAVMIYKGIHNFDGTNTEVEMFNSDIHVFTRLHGRASFTDSDKANQVNAFNDIHQRLVN